jgi:hypothetical protein
MDHKEIMVHKDLRVQLVILHKEQKDHKEIPLKESRVI